MAFYDRIARQWHAQTGLSGGALKRFVLNDVLIRAIGRINDRSILELGAGNGYFLRLLLRRYSGQRPARVVVTDQSEAQLEIAQKSCRVKRAEYTKLDVRGRFPFQEASFDLIIATMVFNEIGGRSLKSCITECRRVVRSDGRLLATVVHPDFVANLDKRGQLRRQRRGLTTMPGGSGLRLPIQMTRRNTYERCLHDGGFDFVAESVYATEDVLNAKPALRKIGSVPLALVFDCTPTGG